MNLIQYGYQLQKQASLQDIWDSTRRGVRSIDNYIADKLGYIPNEKALTPEMQKKLTVLVDVLRATNNDNPELKKLVEQLRISGDDSPAVLKNWWNQTMDNNLSR